MFMRRDLSASVSFIMRSETDSLNKARFHVQCCILSVFERVYHAMQCFIEIE